MINGIILSIFFILPGGIILNMKKVRAKSDIFLIPFISFGYFNFLSLIFFLFDFEPFEYWFFIFSALSLFLIFKTNNKKLVTKQLFYVTILFLLIDTVLNYFTIISLPGNTQYPFDAVYKIFFQGSNNIDIGYIPLTLFTAGLFTTPDFDYSLINIFFIQFIFTSIFAIFTYAKNRKELLTISLFFLSNLLVFEIFYELVTYRSHSLTASSLIVLFTYFHKIKDPEINKLILFFAIFLLFNSRLENIFFGYLYIFSLNLLNEFKFKKFINITISSSLFAGLYLLVIPQSHREVDPRSNSLFYIIILIIGTFLIYKSFFNKKIIYYLSFLSVVTYTLIMYFLYKEIFQSVVALNYTKLLDPNSGYGLQFLLVISIFLYFSNKAQSIPPEFFNFILFIVFMSLYIGILQTVIYQPEASIANIDNLSIFNPLDLSTFRGSVQTLSIFWVISYAAYAETKNV